MERERVVTIIDHPGGPDEVRTRVFCERGKPRRIVTDEKVGRIYPNPWEERPVQGVAQERDLRRDTAAWKQYVSDMGA